MPMSATKNDMVNDDLTTCVILVIIVIIFLICHAIRTFLSFRSYYLFLHNFKRNGGLCINNEFLQYLIIGEVSRIILNFNSSINFFVYCLVGKRFRTELIQIFCKIRHCSYSGSYAHDENEENDGNNSATRMEEITLAVNSEDETVTL